MTLSIFINLSIPISLAQNEQIGTQEKLNVIVKHRNQTVNDALSTNEPVNPSFVVTDREKTLENQVNDLKQDVQNADIRSVLIGLTGIFASIVAYRLAKRDLKSVIDQSVNETVQRTVEKTVEIANAQLCVKEGGKVAIREDKVMGEHTSAIDEEHVPVNDTTNIKVTRSKDQKIVAANIKKISVDAILVNSSDMESNEMKNAKSDNKEKKEDLSKGVKL